ncbi:CDP-glycerol glycerophosphotransferase family protein [Microbacterium hominis]|uniref:CDP-glycerol glycerophosphotransferase family protein n=1 Tax=Microbacterium hominis TaxID=162426 RepID=UPI00249D903F|nr:CDP-glycerol glycerophosphotransferase family protein [Microbacterium hominis]
MLLIRSHPHGAGAYARHAGERIRLLGADLVAEVTPLLPAIDVLITDYSSIVFDAALVPVPAVFLTPDLAAYARTRGFYGTFRDVSGEAPATTWDEAIAQTRAVLTDPAEHARRVAAARALSARVHDVGGGVGSARVFRAIQAALAAERRS